LYLHLLSGAIVVILKSGLFGKDRRSAIALIFALALIPLALLVGLSIDYAFYVQARSQAAMAADAAATHAARAADSAYTNGLAQGLSNAAATTAATTAGQLMGAKWFRAQLGVLPTAVISAGSLAGQDNGQDNPLVQITANNNGSAGFTATVSFKGTYPPFFNALFKQSSSNVWNINGVAGATSSYSYVEILMLLDTSASMLIGATQTDINTLEYNSVCVPTSIPSSNVGFITSNTWGNEYYQNAVDPSGASLNVDETQIKHYKPATPVTKNGVTTYAAGTCNTGYNPANSPSAPCAFACHTDTNKTGASSQDLYGIARQQTNPSVTLRLDVVFSATEDVIKAMSSNEQAANQFSVGVYQFNTDVTPIIQGSVNGSPTEATANLGAASNPASGTALYAVQQDDYNFNPASPVPGVVNTANSYTNFPLSIQHLMSGKYGNGVNGPALTAAGNGATAATPQKDIFIVTDGMEDDSNSGRPSGEMTGVNAENASASLAAAPWLCKPLKNLGFTVYVLYIDYLSLANTFYQTSGATATKYFTNDTNGGSNGTTKDYAEATAKTAGVTAFNGQPPDYAALQACASAPSDFFEASNSSQIGTQMNAMLHAALTSSIQLTQ
jgi:Flp pilus assembly protein TadG